jgi:hypothetical protein
MLADGPAVEHAGLLGEVADERIAADAHALELDFSHEDPERLRDRGVVEEATLATGVQGQQQAPRGTG